MTCSGALDDGSELISWDEPEKRKRYPDGAFALEMRQVHYTSLLPSEVIGRLAEGDVEDAKWGTDLIYSIEHFHFGKGLLTERRLRSVDSDLGRDVVRFMLDMLGNMKRGDGERSKELRVDGPRGFWGRTEAPGAKVRYRRSQPSQRRRRGPLVFGKGDKTVRVSTAGRPHAMRNPRERRYCPKDKVGGLAGLHERSTRTIGNWARFARVARFFGCQQPPRDSTDATLSRRQGDFAYGVWRILRPLPKLMMRRLQRFWGELARRKTVETQETCDERSTSSKERGKRGRAPSARVDKRSTSSKERRRRGHDPPYRQGRLSELERERMRGELAARELPY